MVYATKSFSSLVGETLTGVEGLSYGSDKVTFTSLSGRTFQLHHIQDCCECVSVEDVTGDSKDLLGSPILVAEEVSDAPRPEGHKYAPAESETWTFYKLATVKGWVDIRWWGVSNGYYSERVDFVEVLP